jgi:hypothetical protein
MFSLRVLYKILGLVRGVSLVENLVKTQIKAIFKSYRKLRLIARSSLKGSAGFHKF